MPRWDGAETVPPGPNFHQLLNILWRRRRTIFAIVIVGMALTVLISLMIPPQYTATAQLVYDPQENYSGDRRLLMGAAEVDAIVETHITALTSRPFLGRVLDDLAQDPNFRAVARRPPSGIRWVGDILWRKVGIPLWSWAERLAAPEPPPGALLAQSQMRRLDKFERHVDVYQPRDSHVIAVAFSSTSPTQAALAANRIVQLYVKGEEDWYRANAIRLRHWLDEQIPGAAATLEENETAVENYLTAHNLNDADRSGVTDQRVVELNRQLTAAESDLAQRQAQLASIHNLRRQSSGVDAVVESLDSPADSELLRLRDTLVQAQAEAAVTFGPNHPKAQQLTSQLHEVRRALAQDATRAIDQLKDQVRAASDRVTSIREQLAGLHSATSQAEPALRELNYQAAAAGQVYQGLLQRRAQLLTQQSTPQPSLRILSLASPPDRPSSFSPLLFFLPALIAFAIGGSFVSIAAERLDQGLRSQDEVTAALGIPCVGLVPRLRGMDKIEPHRRLLAEPFATYAEAIRSVVANLHLADPRGLRKSILISSSVPGEGKTTLAVSIAAYAAHIGRRVLLVDLDFRHPRILRKLGGKAQGGILHLLLQDSAPEDFVQRRRGLQFDYLPAYRRTGDPFPLFADERLPRVLHDLGQSYDLVILDGPPLLAVTEARLLATMVDEVVFVVKWGTSRRDITRNALNLLRNFVDPESDRPTLINAVVTQVDLRKHADYRYGDSGESAVRYADYYAASKRSRFTATGRRLKRRGRALLRYGATFGMTIRRLVLAVYGGIRRHRASFD